MRFCPFCSAENADELAVCQSCGRRLPPLPPRKGRNAPPTGIQLPNRPAAPPPPVPSGAAPRRGGNTMPPPIPPQASAPGGSGAPPTIVTPPTGPAAISPSGPAAIPLPAVGPDTAPTTDPMAVAPTTDPMAVAPTPAAGSMINRESAPALPPPPGRDELLNVLNPGPAATRREPSPEPRIIGDRRGRNDPLSPTAFARSKSGSPPPPMTTPRAGSPSQPPPIGGRAGSPSQPPPMSGRAGSPSQPPPMSGRPGSPAPMTTPRAGSPSQPPPIGGRAGSPSQAPPIRGGYPARTHAPSQPPPLPGARSGSQPYAAPPASGPNSTQAFAGAPVPRADSEATRVDPAPSHSPFSLPPPPKAFDGDEFYTKPSAEPIHVMEQRMRGTGSGDTPPATRINRPDAGDRPFTPPKVQPVPEIPEPGLVNAAKYTYVFAIGWWQRRGAIKQLGVEIKQDTEALDQVLGALGRAARGARIEGKVFSVENAGISAAEERVDQLQKENGEVEGRKAEENSKFVDIERERNEKLADAERQVEEGQRELTHLEAQRRSLRDKRKELERRQKAYLKSAEDNDRQAGSAPIGDQRQELRRAAEGHRREAAALDPDRQEIDRRLGSLERPISEATAKVDAAKAELDAAKRSLNDAREGHTHRLAELDAEQKRKSREVALAEGEIARRLVTLGTLVNLNRIEDPQFSELYQRIDRLRGAITARTTEIEKLTAEREAKDNGTFWRGVATIGAAFMLLILLIAILRAIL
jgi:hypothetical protein